ncbi:MAG: magnesium/cobalt transporter CorA, partial [Planctomycetes bacterium]|nr:magnesium/cobalt transporter CorA [Planctomycetota bacterium]
TSLHVIAYGADGIDEADDVAPAEVADWLHRHPVVWLNVVGLGSAEVLSTVGDTVGIHPLALEDVVSVHQRPKVEDYDDMLFVVVRMPCRERPHETEQLSLLVGDGFVVSFEELAGDCFDPVRERIRRGGGRIRERGPDYLAYALLDAVTDSYFPLLETLGDRLEDLEDETTSAPTPATVARLHRTKRELMHLRRAIWPLREVFATLQREETPTIAAGTRAYFRDCHDHVIQLIDLLENYREIAAGLLDVYLTNVSNRMNEIMKVLTIVATVFIPLTFLTSLYGMNFDRRSPWNLPELGWYFGYPICLAVMAAIGVAMVLYFRRLGWLGRRRREP